MNQKIIFLIVAISALGIVGGIVLSIPEKFDLCGYEQLTSCIEPMGRIGQPLFMISVAVFLSSILILIFPRTLRTWAKFAAWYIPLAAILIALTGDGGGGFSPDIDSELVTWFLSILYLVVSVAIIVTSAIRSRQRPP